jgi:hypothetical protein
MAVALVVNPVGPEGPDFMQMLKQIVRCITTVTLMGDKTVSFVPVEQCSIKKYLFATGGTTQIVRPQNLITGSMTTYIRTPKYLGAPSLEVMAMMAF